MDVNERFEQWLQSLTKECEAKSSQIKGDSAKVDGDKKKDKKKKNKEYGEKNGNHLSKSDAESEKDGIHGSESTLEDSMEVLNKLSMNGLYGNINDSLGNQSARSEHDDLNEILRELTSSHESDNSFHTEDNCVHGDSEPTVDIGGGIHINSAGRQSPKFLYKEPNSPTYLYFNPPMLSAVGKKSKLICNFVLQGNCEVLRVCMRLRKNP